MPHHLPQEYFQHLKCLNAQNGRKLTGMVPNLMALTIFPQIETRRASTMFHQRGMGTEYRGSFIHQSLLPRLYPHQSQKVIIKALCGGRGAQSPPAMVRPSFTCFNLSQHFDRHGCCSISFCDQHPTTNKYSN